MTPFPREAYRPLVPYAPDRRPIAVDLSDNTSRWGAHPAALQAIRGADPEDLLRYPSVYADGLREAVARRFDVPEAAVATGCGSDDLLDSAFRAAGEPGDRVAFLPPTFSMVETFAQMNGMDPRPAERGAPREGEPFGPAPDPEALLACRPALIYLCRPNNPTGEVLPRGWVRELEAAAGPDGPVLLLDEAYADFMGGGEDRDALLREAARSRRTVVLRTLSKAYGLAGLRVGFAVGAPEVIREIEKSRGPYKVGRVGERAAVAALEDREGWVRDVLASVRQQRRRLREALEDRRLAPLPSGANFLLLPLAAGPWGGERAGAWQDGRAGTCRDGRAGPGRDARGGPCRDERAGPGRDARGGPWRGERAERGRGAAGARADEVTAALRQLGVAVRPFPTLAGHGDAIRISIGPRPEMDRFLEALDRILE